MAYKKAAPEETAFKHLINEKTVSGYAAFFKNSGLLFEDKKFKTIVSHLTDLELKGRTNLIAQALHECLKQNTYPQILKSFKDFLKQTSLSGFELWPLSTYIQKYGLDKPKDSLEFLKFMTPYFTAEFAIRPYLSKYSESTYLFLLECTENSNEHVRRWASEGCRPRLPWGEKLHAAEKDPREGLKILEQLRFDPSEYVRKSVANHLNDICLHHPDLVIKTLNSWKKEAKKTGNGEFIANLEKLIKQALRNLIKNGHPEALELIGASMKTKVKIKNLEHPDKVHIGQELYFSFDLQAKAKGMLVIDYAIHFVKKNGKTQKKIFKLKNLSDIEGISIQKKHSFKLVTTRTYYPGLHALEIFINGKSVHIGHFKLLPLKK